MAKIERVPDGLPRQMHCLLFKKPHPLAGQVVRFQRYAAIFFNVDEAGIEQAKLEDGGKIPVGMTEVVRVMVKDRRAMVKPGYKLQGE